MRLNERVGVSDDEHHGVNGAMMSEATVIDVHQRYTHTHTHTLSHYTYTAIILVTGYGRHMEYGRPLYFRPVVSFFFFFLPSFFPSPNLSGHRLDVCHTSTHGCGLSANLECRSEMYCTRLAENAGCKKSPSGHHRTTLPGYIFATKAVSTIRKKVVKLQYLLHISP